MNEILQSVMISLLDTMRSKLIEDRRNISARQTQLVTKYEKDTKWK